MDEVYQRQLIASRVLSRLKPSWRSLKDDPLWLCDEQPLPVRSSSALRTLDERTRTGLQANARTFVFRPNPTLSVLLPRSRDVAAVGSECPVSGWQGQFQGHSPALSCCRGNVAPRLSPGTTVRRVNRRDDDTPSLPDATQGIRHSEGHQIVIRRVLPGATPAHHGQIVAQAVH